MGEEAEEVARAGTAPYDTSVHANTPEQASANAKMTKLRREGAVPRRTPAEQRRALQRKLYNARIRATKREDDVALARIAQTLAELNDIDAESEGADTALQSVEEGYDSWRATQ